MTHTHPTAPLQVATRELPVEKVQPGMVLVIENRLFDCWGAKESNVITLPGGRSVLLQVAEVTAEQPPLDWRAVAGRELLRLPRGSVAVQALVPDNQLRFAEAGVQP